MIRMSTKGYEKTERIGKIQWIARLKFWEKSRTELSNKTY